MALKGKKLTKEHRNKLSISHKGQVPWNKGIKTGIKPWLGKKRSQETIEKIRKSKKGVSNHKLIGKKLSEDTKLKISLSLTGKKQSDETKQKRSLALKGRKVGFAQNPVHSKKTKIKMKELAKKHIGSNNYNWKGGITKLAEKIRKSCLYKDWRDDILKRDNYKCTECNKKDCYLIVHHVNHFAKILEENKITNLTDAYNCDELWHRYNGITLCKNCHSLKHTNLNLYEKK